MASIGGVTCTFVKGCIPALKQRSEKWNVPGISGYGVALLGTGDSEFTVRAVFLSTNSAVNSWAASLYAKQGMIVTIVNDHGDSNSRCFIESVEPVQKSTLRIPGSSITTRGEIQIKAVVV